MQDFLKYLPIDFRMLSLQMWDLGSFIHPHAPYAPGILKNKAGPACLGAERGHCSVSGGNA